MNSFRENWENFLKMHFQGLGSWVSGPTFRVPHLGSWVPPIRWVPGLSGLRSYQQSYVWSPTFWICPQKTWRWPKSVSKRTWWSKETQWERKQMTDTDKLSWKRKGTEKCLEIRLLKTASLQTTNKANSPSRYLAGSSLIGAVKRVN